MQRRHAGLLVARIGGWLRGPEGIPQQLSERRGSEGDYEMKGGGRGPRDHHGRIDLGDGRIDHRHAGILEVADIVGRNSRLA
jgi:hypothetical protein